MITGDGKTIIPGGAVACSGAKITAVGTLEELKAKFPGEEVTEYPGMTLMPGMIDLHNHISYTWGTPNEPIFNLYPMTKAMFAMKRMKDTLANGVTTIRDLASADNIGVALNYGKMMGYIDVPRIFTSCKGIIATGGHGWSLNGAVAECDGPWEVRKAVRTNYRDGANCIKILTSEGYRGLEMNQEEINAAVDEAHRFGLRVASHAGIDPALQMSIDGGCDTIEHGTHLTVAQAEQMKANDQTWVPTMFCFFYVQDLTVKDASSEFLSANAKYLVEATECYTMTLRSSMTPACASPAAPTPTAPTTPRPLPCIWSVNISSSAV